MLSKASQFTGEEAAVTLCIRNQTSIRLKLQKIQHLTCRNCLMVNTVKESNLTDLGMSFTSEGRHLPKITLS